MSKNKKEDFKNPSDYAYKGDEEVKITGFQFREAIASTREMLANEIKEWFPEQTKMVNREYQEASEEEIANGEAFEVLDIEAMLQNPKPVVYYSRLGLRLLRQQFMLEGVHADNVEKGVAIPIEELRKQAVESQKPKMSVVKD